jgi:hypothetical protein
MKIFKFIETGVVELEPHHFGGPGPATRCGSGFKLVCSISRSLKMSQNVAVSYVSNSHV